MTVKIYVFNVKVFVILLVLSRRYYCQEVGEECTVKSTGDTGTCKISGDCPSVEEQAKRGITPTICGFHQLTIPIVCCENLIDIGSKLPQPNDHSIESNSEDSDISFPDDSQSLQDTSFFTGSVRKSEAKCLEYTKTITDTVHVLPLDTHSSPIGIKVEKCDYNSVPLIVGGSPATAGEFPFMASLGFLVGDEIEWKCGGTLVSEHFVLTAAHCTFSRESDGPKVVRLGELDQGRTDDSEHADYNVKKIIVHPGYSYPLKYNDIALLETDKIIVFSKFIRPACVYTKSTVEQSIGIATGWGKTDFTADNSERLMKVALNLYDSSLCAKTYAKDKHLPRGIEKTMMCAGELKGGKDTCLGDSGGPLLITEKSNQCKFYIIGITSFGKACAQVNTPAVYTKVSEYVKWIEDTIW